MTVLHQQPFGVSDTIAAPGHPAWLEKATLDVLTDPVAVVDRHGRLRFVNPAWRDFAAEHPQCGRLSEGDSLVQAIARADDGTRAALGELLSGVRDILAGKRQRFETVCAMTVQGRERWFEARATQLRARPSLCALTLTDVTAHCRNERDLQRFRVAVQATSDAILIGDVETMTIVDVNDAACALFGGSRKALLNRVPEQLFAMSRVELAASWQALVAHAPTDETSESRHTVADGRALALEVRRRAVHVGDAWLVVTVMRDITARRDVERALQRHALQQDLLARFGHFALENPPLAELNARAADILQSALAAPFCRVLEAGDSDHVLTQAAGHGWEPRLLAEPSFDAIAETEDRFVLGARETIVVNDYESEMRFKGSPIIAAHGIRSAVEGLVCGAGGSYGVVGAYSPEPGFFAEDSVNFVQSVANTLAAAIERRYAEGRLSYLAQFDALTGLPNRTMYLDRLGQSLVEAERDHRPVGVLFVDLDRFKAVNDTFGHAIGDLVLEQAANRLNGAVRAGDTVGRLGGDEFAVALAHLANADDAASVAQKLVTQLSMPFHIGGHTIYVSASIGISVHPVDGSDPDTLLKCADTAMYRAKESGRAGYHFYLPQMNERALARMRLESALHGAVEREEFLLHYQPKVSLVDGTISGLEALLRWQPPHRELVSPAEFIPILEETGLIIEVGEWVVASVCAQISRWQSEGVPPPRVAVNLSARQFHQQGLADSIGRIVAANGIAPDLLEFEITESVIMTDTAKAVEALRQMKARGIHLSIDDFGTGYSSLAYLKRFPIDTLKIDRAFIRDVTTDPDDATITLAIINLAHSLGLKVVAEGVETAEQLAFLRGHGCDEIQGFYFARPLPAAQVTGVLREGKRLALSAA